MDCRGNYTIGHQILNILFSIVAYQIWHKLNYSEEKLNFLKIIL